MDDQLHECWQVSANDFPKTSALSEKLVFLLRYALLAPSAHNTQPWSYVVHGSSIQVLADFSRKLTASDVDSRQLYLSLGCTIENILIAADYFGLSYQIEYFYAGEEASDRVAKIEFKEAKKNATTSPSSNTRADLFTAVTQRMVNRSPFQKKKVPAKIKKSYQQLLVDFHMSSLGIGFSLVDEPMMITQIGTLLQNAILQAMAPTEFRQELAEWLRHNWSKQGDGLPGYVLDMPNIVSLLSPALIQSDVMISQVADSESKLVAQAPLIGIVTAKQDNPNAWVQAGQFLEDIALHTTNQKLDLSFHTALIESPTQRKKLKKLLQTSDEPVAVVRLGYATKTYPHAPRRPLAEVLIELDNDFEENPYFSSTFARPHIFPQQENKKIINWYQNYPIEDYHAFARKKTTEELQKAGADRAFALFQQAAQHVPAYKDFLQKNGIKRQSIQSASDLQFLPITDKDNYISQYSMNELSWNGRVSDQAVISFSSGSSGKPYFWPRSTYQQVEGALIYEQFMTQLFDIDKKSTLMVVAFSMGAYVAGTYTLASLQALQAKGYAMSIVSPGIETVDTLRMVRNLAPYYDQVIFCGYPPFVKDLLDQGIEEKVAWEEMDIKFFFASDFFSEGWRDHVYGLVGKEPSLKDSTNIYGTADATVFGHETPLTTLLRRMGKEDSSLHQELFKTNLNPTFVQYNPLMRYFELSDGELILTAAAGLPLIRYNLHDQGGLLTQKDIDQVLSSRSLNSEQLLLGADCFDTLNNLPYVYITTRTDGAISLYGVLIYPDFVRPIVEHPALTKILTGKFAMRTVDSRVSREQTIELHFELAQGTTATAEMHQQVSELAITTLMTKSGEYAMLSKEIKEKAIPHIFLHEKGDTNFFEKKIKQRWIKKS